MHSIGNASYLQCAATRNAQPSAMRSHLQCAATRNAQPPAMQFSSNSSIFPLDLNEHMFDITNTFT
ncbi:MAG: hypothetical protein KJ970_12890 [Candidatus Eisenbacteria bacterium]|uniref:Uncharacterized protein n=1 Tax=Eiseniibacteriota bacterium TaxID=2212470 RepID=A0A948W741_UNCEI|nr:hypothetical protein [Candidatus Eisenbacteria bacterium]